MTKRKSKNASMKVRVPGAKNSIDKMKYEIANEFGVNLGANATSRDNGIVGGEITKRLVENGMSSSKNNSTAVTNGNSKKNTSKRTRKTKKSK